MTGGSARTACRSGAVAETLLPHTSVTGSMQLGSSTDGLLTTLLTGRTLIDSGGEPRPQGNRPDDALQLAEHLLRAGAEKG